MKLKIKDLNGNVVKEIDLPKQFEEPYRQDLISRCVIALQSHRRHPYGAYIRAGKQHVTWLSKRRQDYKSQAARGISRVPRKTLLRRGNQFYWIGAFAPGTVGGRRAHPPKVEKVWFEKINDKERRKAIRSAIASTLNIDLVKIRNHILPKDWPFGIVDDIKNISKTKELINILKKLGFEEELKRAKEKKIRAGKGKRRGRRYRKKKSLLIVVDSNCNLKKAAKNIPGIDVVEVRNINAEILSPGTHGIRLTLWCESAIKKLSEGLFL